MSKTFFNFQYTESNQHQQSVCETGIFCAHVNIAYILSFDEADGRLTISDGSWYVLSEEDGEKLSEILQMY